MFNKIVISIQENLKKLDPGLSEKELEYKLKSLIQMLKNIILMVLR